MKTHICIATAPPNKEGIKPIIFKGDCATFVAGKEMKTMKSGFGYKFMEHPRHWYDSSLFLSLPPQQEKVVYVAISEEIIKRIEEPMLS